MGHNPEAVTTEDKLAKPKRKKAVAKAKRTVIMSDLHCGHITGLTSPAYQIAPQCGTKAKAAQVQKKLWEFYAKTIDSLKPIDVLIVNGDCIDGRGERSGGTELVFPDRSDQVGCAAECIRYTEAEKIVMTYGTPYHTGQEEDWEDVLAREIGAKIGAHEWVDINGLVFDVKHHVGSSQIPHGRHTAVARERLWSQLWAEREQTPKADVIIRSHVHYFDYCGGRDWLAMTTPALQGLGTKFGARRCSGTVDFGLLSFDVASRDEWSWHWHIAELIQRARVTRV